MICEGVRGYVVVAVIDPAGSWQLAGLPDDIDLGPVFAIDTETMGLNLTRDRLCVVQVSSGNGDAHVIQMPQRAQPGVSPFAGSGIQLAPNLSKQLADPSRLKLMHFARFDIASAKKWTSCFCITVPRFGCMSTLLGIPG